MSKNCFSQNIICLMDAAMKTMDKYGTEIEETVNLILNHADCHVDL